MLKAIEFVSQADGLVGREIAKRSFNQNSFMNNVISLGRNQEFLDSLSEKCGELILPVIEYSAVGGVYHQLKGPFTEYMADGIVGSELPQEKREKAPRAPRAVRASRAQAPSPAQAQTAKLGHPLVEAIKYLRRDYPVSSSLLRAMARMELDLKKNSSKNVDTSALTLAKKYRDAGKVALAEMLESEYYGELNDISIVRDAIKEKCINEILNTIRDHFGEEVLEKVINVAQ